MIIRMGLSLSWNALKELIDTAMSQDEVDAIRKSIIDTDGVVDLHMLRTRLMAGRALVDVHLQVNGNISVSEGHQISENVRNQLIDEFENVDQVLVHIDPEDDEKHEVNIDLPLREEMTKRINDAIASVKESPPAEKITLHYLKGNIDIDLIFPTIPEVDDTTRRETANTVSELLHQDPHVGKVKIYFHYAH
jgi:hypothetical protein